MTNLPSLEAATHYKGFHILRSLPIDELQVQLIEIEHEGSGAKILHLANQDPENLFCLSLQTRPYNSNGVAHILEHTVLCGSKHYPVHDPFFSMTRRSLNTYMNALTGADFTCYPAASLVEADFYNLLRVYLDAVFHPLLDPLSFKQEGHRLEYDEPEEATSPLAFKGVVYNEMKGSMASADARLFETISSLLYPDITYGFNSGGDPKEILHLTYEELLEFHRTYYHPSRCLFYFYGNLPTTKHLDFLAEQLLENCPRIEPIPPTPRQPRFSSPKRGHCFYPANEGETEGKNSSIGIAWIVAHLSEQEKLLALSLLDILLTDNDASPLKRTLLDSGLCKQAQMFLDTENSDVPWILLLKGCDGAKVDHIEALVLNSLRELSEHPFSEESIQRSLHQLELYRTEISGGSIPFGLTLFFRAALTYPHGIAPERALKIHTLFDELREKLADPAYLPQLLRSCTVDNPHRTLVLCTPRRELAEEELEQEKNLLEAIKAQHKGEDKKKIIEETKKLALFQEREDSEEEILPKLAIEEIPRTSGDYPLWIGRDRELELFHHETFTNGMLYTTYLLPLPFLSEEELPYAQLMTSLLGQMGLGHESFEKTLERMQACTGGIGASLQLYGSVGDPKAFTPTLALGGKALSRHGKAMVELLVEIASDPSFRELGRLRELLLKQWSSLQNSLNNHAMRYANNLATAPLRPSGICQYSWYGLGYYKALQKIALDIERELEPVAERLSLLQRRLLHGNNPHLVISSSKADFDSLQRRGFFGLGEVAKTAFSPWQSPPLLEMASHGRIIASPVAFNAMALPTIAYAHPDNAALMAAAPLMENICLHKSIREQGGAYGSGGRYHATSGLFSFHSYRDPHIASSYTAFQRAISMIASGQFDEKELYEAKLSCFQKLDSPASPGERAAIGYGWWREGKSLEVRQNLRERLFSLTASEVAKAATDHLLPHLSSALRISFAGEELLRNEMKECPQLPI